MLSLFQILRYSFIKKSAIIFSFSHSSPFYSCLLPPSLSFTMWLENSSTQRFFTLALSFNTHLVEVIQISYHSQIGFHHIEIQELKEVQINYCQGKDPTNMNFNHINVWCCIQFKVFHKYFILRQQEGSKWIQINSWWMLFLKLGVSCAVVCSTL